LKNVQSKISTRISWKKCVAPSHPAAQAAETVAPTVPTPGCSFSGVAPRENGPTWRRCPPSTVSWIFVSRRRLEQLLAMVKAGRWKEEVKPSTSTLWKHARLLLLRLALLVTISLAPKQVLLRKHAYNH